MTKVDLSQTISLGDIIGDAEAVCSRPVDPERTALVIVDMQGDPDESRSDLQMRALKGSERLLHAARESKMKVIHITLGYWTLDGTDLEYFMQREMELSESSGIQKYVKKSWDSPQSKILPSLAPVKGEIVLKKTTQSAFTTTGMATMLHNMRVRDLVFCGMQTDGCCGFTAAAAVSYGFLPVMVEDACSARTKAGHLAFLRIFQQHVGRVALGEDIISEFKKS